MARTFEFVPYGQKFESDKKSICVDGLVPGTSLQLTHWNGNETPKEYKADLSTDIVLKFIHAELGSEKNKWNDAVVLNNHFDTDGLLSVWIMLNPEAAMKYERRMVDAAAAGDFDEWGLSDWGLQLDLAFSKLASQCDGDKQAYEKLLPMVEDILVNVDDREELWKEELDEMYKIFDMVCDDKIVTTRVFDERSKYTKNAGKIGDVGVVVHPPGSPKVNGKVLSRTFPIGQATDAQVIARYLMAYEQPDGKFHYEYERPHHAWAETVKRANLSKPNAPLILENLGSEWTTAGLNGMTAICKTQIPISKGPMEVAGELLDLERSLLPVFIQKGE